LSIPRLNDHARHLAHQTADARELCRVDLGPDVVEIVSHVQRHDDLFERSVACALADAVDCNLDLPRAVLHGRQAVGDGQPEVVVAVDADHRVFDARHVLPDHRDALTELAGNRIADGIRDIQCACARFDRRLERFVHEVHFRSAGILGAELDILTETPSISDHLADLLEHLGSAHTELVLPMDRGRRDEGVDSAVLGRCHCLRRLVDVRFVSPCQAADCRRLGDRPALDARDTHGLGDGLDCTQVVGRSRREAGFNHIHPQPR
jgi:hypothetical protein